MNRRERHWFHRGKEARRLGEPARLSSARVAARHRDLWHRGWQEQDAWMKSRALRESRDERLARMAKQAQRWRELREELQRQRWIEHRKVIRR